MGKNNFERIEKKNLNGIAKIIKNKISYVLLKQLCKIDKVTNSNALLLLLLLLLLFMELNAQLFGTVRWPRLFGGSQNFPCLCFKVRYVISLMLCGRFGKTKGRSAGRPLLLQHGAFGKIGTP